MFFTATKDRIQNQATASGVADRTAEFELLMRDTQRQAYSLAYRLTGNAPDAEDLVQEAYVRAYRFFHRYDETLPFISWLYRILSNTHIDMFRRKGKLRTLSISQASEDGKAVWELPDCESSPDREMLNGTMDAPIQAALQRMNPEFRTAVLLSDVDGLAYEEVAEIMNTSVGTVRSRIHRGRRQIRNFLLERSPEFCKRVRDEL